MLNKQDVTSSVELDFLSNPLYHPWNNCKNAKTLAMVDTDDHYGQFEKPSISNDCRIELPKLSLTMVEVRKKSNVNYCSEKLCASASNNC